MQQKFRLYCYVITIQSSNSVFGLCKLDSKMFYHEDDLFLIYCCSYNINQAGNDNKWWNVLGTLH